MFKVIFYNFLWFLSLTSTAFAASQTVKMLFEGTITDLIGSLVLMAFSIFTFVSVDRLFRTEGI